MLLSLVLFAIFHSPAHLEVVTKVVELPVLLFPKNQPEIASLVLKSAWDKNRRRLEVCLFVRSFVIAGRGPAYSGPQR